MSFWNLGQFRIHVFIEFCCVFWTFDKYLWCLEYHLAIWYVIVISLGAFDMFWGSLIYIYMQCLTYLHWGGCHVFGEFEMSIVSLACVWGVLNAFGEFEIALESLASLWRVWHVCHGGGGVWGMWYVMEEFATLLVLWKYYNVSYVTFLSISVS